MNRKLTASLLLYSFGLDTAAFAGARPFAAAPVARPRAEARRATATAPAAPAPVAPEALEPASPLPPPPDPPAGSCDLDGQGGVVVAHVQQSTSADFNVDPPVCSGDADLCGAFSYDKSGPTPDTWKAVFDVGGKKLLIETGATVSVVNVPATSNNQKAPGLEIRSSCALEVQAGASVSVGSVNQPAGDIFVKVDGDVLINGTVRNSVSGTNGTPGKVTIASCLGDLSTGPQSRIETIGVDHGGKDINLLTCPAGGDVMIGGLVRAVHKYSTTPNVNVVSFGGSVTIDGRNDFGMDPFEGNLFEASSLHKYAYGAAAPQDRRDPTGRFSLAEGLVIGAIVTVIAAIAIIGVVGGAVQGFVPPSADFLKNEPTIRAKLAEAWSLSDAGNIPFMHEEGGWIYMNPQSRAVTAELKQIERDIVRILPLSSRKSINLCYPPERNDKVVVGFFHVHPFPKTFQDENGFTYELTPGPSDPDRELSARAGIPGVVMDYAGIHGYGQRRMTFAGPRGLPRVPGGCPAPDAIP